MGGSLEALGTEPSDTATANRSSEMDPVKVEFMFDFGSPNAYLAELVIPDVERRTGVKFEYVPVLLGGIYKLTNNRSPGESLAGIKNKPEFMELEIERFIRRHNVTTFHKNPFFPVNTLQLMRGAVAAQFEGLFEPYPWGWRFAAQSSKPMTGASGLLA